MKLQRSGRTTIKDVARAAGVSVTTVSNVLNGHVDAMAPATLACIRELMASLGYRPSAIARSLVSGRRAVVALVLLPMPGSLSLETVASLQDRLRSEGRELALLAPGADTEPLVACEAVIVLGSPSDAELQPFQPVLESAGAVITVGGAGPQRGYANVGLGLDGGVRDATTYLRSLGHTSLGWLAAPAGNALSETLRRTFDGAILEAGVESDPRWREPAGGTDRESVRRWARDLLALRARPSAVVVEDDTLAAILIRELLSAGQRVPADLSVVGIGDEAWCEYVSPRLTSVRLPIPEALASAVDLALGLEASSAPLSCSLVARDSAGPARRGPAAQRAADSAQSSLW